MKANKHVAILGQKVVLVPYRKEHVKKYHEWMSDPEIRELTASEPLSLEEEYDMQRKWQEDEDKLTFIILARSQDTSVNASLDSRTRDEIESCPMIGDVNLFLKGSKDEEDFEAEVEIMIAEPSYRRKGLALSSLQLFLSYATLLPGSAPSQLVNGTYSSPLPVQPSDLVVRISASNSPSINMFTKLGFVETKRVEIFNEVEMRLSKAGEGWKERMGEDSWSNGAVVWYE